MRTNFAVQDGNTGCGLNYWLGALISQGVALRDEDIVTLCFAEPGALFEGMSFDERTTLTARRK